MEGPSHLLSLKVMRVSRPALATAWEPFYSSSSSFSAHSTASLMSLQGNNPLPGHPKTLRDLTHISEMLMLPSAFGAIQLGETFSSCLSVNNEASVDIEGVTLRVEMQTATSKAVLAEYGGPNYRLTAGQTLENVVHHEIKELGQHVLACTVSYRLPSDQRPAQLSSEAHDANVQSFRKFYKFVVTNPLSVKTKVHVPRSPTAMLSPTEREKVFLEVHIQNLTPDALWLQRMRFEAVEGWHVDDANLSGSKDIAEEGTIFTGSMSLIHPQDTRQYVYILSPRTIPVFPIVHTPGSIIPLGRLDISWRSAFGEPGRLLTSMLSRRIPLIQAAPAPSRPPVPPPKQASALPLHLQRSNTVAGPSGTPPRVQSPQLGQRPLSPPVTSQSAPYRPGSPFNRTRTSTTMSLPAQPSSPSVPPPPNPAVRRQDEAVDVDLVVRDIPRDTLSVEQPFKIGFTLTVSAPVPRSYEGQPRKVRILSLVVQHVQHEKKLPAAIPPPVSPPPLPTTDAWSPRLPLSGFSTPSPYATPSRGDFPDSLSRRLLVASPRQAAIDLESDAGPEAGTGQATPSPYVVRGAHVPVILPPPFSVPDQDVPEPTGPHSVSHLGPSAIFLPQLRLALPHGIPGIAQGDQGHDRNLSESTVDSETDSDLHATISASIPRALSSQSFELEFVPLKAGYAVVGGLRVLVVEDRLADEEDPSVDISRTVRPTEVRTLKEWDVVGEVWVKTMSDVPLS